MCVRWRVSCRVWMEAGGGMCGGLARFEKREVIDAHVNPNSRWVFLEGSSSLPRDEAVWCEVWCVDLHVGVVTSVIKYNDILL